MVVVFRPRALLPARGRRQEVNVVALSPVDDPQAFNLVGPVRHDGLRGMWSVHRLVSGRHRHHRGSGRDRPVRHRIVDSRPGAWGRDVSTSIAQLVRTHPFTAGLDDQYVALIEGCSRNVAFAPGDLLCREGESADTFYLLRRGLSRSTCTRPGAPRS